MSDWMWLSIGILEMTMVIADEITNQRFRWLLRKHFLKLNRDQIIYIAYRGRNATIISRLGLLPVLCALIAIVLFNSTRAMAICFAIGTIFYTISWHIRSNLASNIKIVARASDSNASEEKK